MRIALALAALSLSACVMPTDTAATRPTEVRLGGTTMTVAFSDGSVCRAQVPMEGGAGRLEGCAHALDWSVIIKRRNFLEPIFGAAVAPYARITLSDGAGQTWAFRTPVDPATPR